jgi:hypothetical protein
VVLTKLFSTSFEAVLAEMSVPRGLEVVDGTACRDSWGKQWVSLKGVSSKIALVWTHPSRHARRLHALVWSTSTLHGGKGQLDIGHAEPITRHWPDDPRRSSTETATFT